MHRRRMLLAMMQQNQSTWRDVVKTGTGLIVADDTSEGQPFTNFEMQGWTEQPSTTGAQLLKLDDKTIKINGITVDIINGSVNIKGIPENKTGHTIFTIGNINLKKGDYVTSVELKVKGIGIAFASIVNPSSGSPNITMSQASNISKFSISEDQTSSVILNISNEESSYNVMQYFMLTEGKEKKPYEPYTGGKPSPSTDYTQEINNAGSDGNVEIKLLGGQLFDSNVLNDSVTSKGITILNNKDGSFSISGDNSGTGTVNLMGKNDFKLLPGTYTLSGNSSKCYLVLKYNNGIKDVYINGDKTFTISDTAVISCYLQVVLPFSENEAIKPMLNLGDKETEFEPYRYPQTLTLTSDRPLTKWDRLAKKDGQWGWEYKSIELVFTGEEAWYPHSNEAYETFYISKYLPFSDNRRDGFCPAFTVGKIDQNVWLGLNNSNIYITKNPYYDSSSEDKGLTKWKEYLKENNMQIVTYADEPEFIPLSEPEQQALNALRTYYPTTVILNDQNMFMQAEYKTKVPE